MQGKIVKGISGFYYVYVIGTGIYECKAKGVFRKQGIKPLVGDMVEIAVIDEDRHIGNVEELLPRKNALIRPAVANIDMALVIFAAAKPQPNLNLLDRFLCMMEYQKVPVTICFNKRDLVTEEEQEALRQIYAAAGYPILFVSARTKDGIPGLKALLKGKTTTVAGPSGVGKSSLINELQSEIHMQTGGESRPPAIRKLFRSFRMRDRTKGCRLLLWILRDLAPWMCRAWKRNSFGPVIRNLFLTRRTVVLLGAVI